jgi:hypothetical protein
MQSAHERTRTEERAEISELATCQLTEITGGASSVSPGICEFFKDGHLVGPPIVPGKHPPIL